MSFLWMLTNIRNPVLNTIMMGLSYVGTPFAIVGFITWFYYNVDKKTAECMSFSFYLGGLFCQSLKLIFHIPRPWIRDTTFQAVEAAVPSAGGYSFPSIHTQSSTAFFVALIYLYRSKKVRAVSAVLLALIIFSRMYLGCHTPLDVGVAFFISLIVTVIVCYLILHSGNQKLLIRFLLSLIVLFALITLILDFTFLYSGTVDSANAKDAFSTVGIALGFVFGTLIERRYVHFSCKAPLLHKVMRFVIAIAVALLLFVVAMKAIFPYSPGMEILRYFLLLFWMQGIWPLLFTRVPKLRALLG